MINDYGQVEFEIADKVKEERIKWEAPLRKLRDAVVAQNRAGATWGPDVFPAMMDGLAQASMLLDK